MRDKFIIEQAANGYIVTEEDGNKMIYRKMEELLKDQFAIVADMAKSSGKIEVELSIAEIDYEETDELAEE